MARKRTDNKDEVEVITKQVFLIEKNDEIQKSLFKKW